MTQSATPLMLAELIRLGCTAPPVGGEKKSTDFWLVETGASRARASASFNVSVSLSWRVELGPVSLVDHRGYLVDWTFSELAVWLAKSLSGQESRLTINCDDASKIPALWTPERVQSQVAKYQALASADIRLIAQAKRSTVAGWSPGERRAAVLAAAARMDAAADFLDAMRAPAP